MIERVREDLSQAREASKGVPAWVLLGVLFGSPGGSALLAGNVTSGRMEAAVEQLQEQLKAEVAERKRFEEKCQAERQATDKVLSDLRLDQREQQLLLTQVRQTQERLLDQVRTYQADMLTMVRGIAADIPGLHLATPPRQVPVP